MPMEREMKQEVLQMNLETTLSEMLGELYGKTIREADNAQIYHALLRLCKRIMAATPEISGDKKVYYISAEFLIGKLLSNNLINLGIYDRLEEGSFYSLTAGVEEESGRMDRTFKIIRSDSGRQSYAKDIAVKCGVTYDQLVGVLKAAEEGGDLDVLF